MWVCIGVFAVMALLCAFLVEKAYRDGVTDGAFKQYKPTVRRIMLEYDSWGAQRILSQYDARGIAQADQTKGATGP